MTIAESPIVAEAPGVRIAASARGGHLMSWTTHGIERLWMSPLSTVGQSEALRGGVPVLFPQFGTFGDLPKHGFARTADWQQVPAAELPGRACLSFEFTDTEQTRAVWPHPFRVRLDISASPTELTMDLTVDNRGPDIARFTGGLHTYLAVADPEAWIEGLAGGHVWDGDSTQQPNFPVRIDGPVRALAVQDQVVHGVVAPLILHDAVLGDMHVVARGFSHRVVWNPGPEHTLPDVGAGDEARFVCIEPVSVVPVVLPAGGTWEGRQRLHLN